MRRPLDDVPAMVITIEDRENMKDSRDLVHNEPGVTGSRMISIPSSSAVHCETHDGCSEDTKSKHREKNSREHKPAGFAG
jgi:hypothetical protein